jgi:hypothetical protein
VCLAHQIFILYLLPLHLQIYFFIGLSNPSNPKYSNMSISSVRWQAAVMNHPHSCLAQQAEAVSIPLAHPIGCEVSGCERLSGWVLSGNQGMTSVSRDKCQSWAWRPPQLTVPVWAGYSLPDRSSTALSKLSGDWVQSPETVACSAG